ncbi:histone-like nucleoid-structuring protein Lsr2 [Williamsia soli]|uniref:histone-like nucleoid-structuring protein Lsr2 n=1 Tax=Williamsia soli TaxID=364929 RepID=UPI001A9F2591|nr:Lsr2 family protein [Williamsia soli]
MTRVEFTDDIDGKALEIDDLNVVGWTWLGVDYEFDTSTTNLDRIESGRVPLSTLLARSRRVGGRKRTPGTKAPANVPAPAVSNAATKTIRSWAQQNGYQLGDRGRIPADVVEAFTKQN